MTSTLIINLPDDVRGDIERLAEENGVSPEEFVAAAAAEKAGAIQSASHFFSERAKHGSREAFKRVFGLGREGEPPAPGDEVN